MCASVQDTFQETRIISEPAGALALAGLKKYTLSRGLKNKKLVAINSGANLNFDRLGHIVERVQLGESKEALLSVKIPEVKGSFRKFCNFLGKEVSLNSITELKKVKRLIYLSLAGLMRKRARTNY